MHQSFNLREYIRAMILMVSVLFAVSFVVGMLGVLPPAPSKRFPELGRLPGSLILISSGISFLACWVAALFNFLLVISSKRDDANLEDARSYFGYYVLSAHYLTEEGLAARSRLFFFFITACALMGFAIASLSGIGVVFDL